ncbi:MAG: hypothetical protein ACKOI2_13565 [Actinomycetota bacterium]
MGFIERLSKIRRVASRKAADPTVTTRSGSDPKTAGNTRAGLTSSRNPDRHGPPFQEVIGLMSWGGLTFAATLFIRMDNPREIFVAWALAIFLVTWIVTALASHTVRLIPVRNKNQGSDRRR